MKIVAVSACPSGLMHTYMAAESLKKAAMKRGYDIKVETHGAIGKEDILKKEDIEQSDVVIIMADIHVDTSRFLGKKIISVSTAYGIRHTFELLDKIGGLHDESVL